MPRLKDKAITLLGSATVDMKTAGTTTIFTTESGRVTRIVQVVVRDPTASMAGGTSYNFGTSFRNAGIIDLSSLIVSGTDYIVLDQNNTKSTEIASATAFQIVVTTGTTLACNAGIDVFGYTV